MHSLYGLAVALAVAGGGGDPSVNERTIETVMQDDAQLLHRSPRQVRRATRRMAAIGVDRVRLTASWSILAPAPESRRRPRFDASSSRAYPEGGFARLDRAVREVEAAGMESMIDIAFFAPRWAVRRGSPEDGRHVWRPSTRQFALFSQAVAERYSGRFHARRGAGAALPAVRLWTTWNEPNHPVFLRPQWERAGARWRPAAPHIYRRLHEAAYGRIKAVRSANSVLIGGLASFGRAGRGPLANVGPLRFTRELACVDGRLEPLGRAACRDFRPLRADGFAHHPYSLDTAPGARDPSRDRVQIAELDRLDGLLDELHRRGRIENPLPLYLTEYGYETNPPDPRGRSGEEHGRYLGQATYLAWRRPEVRMFPQFLLEDIGPDRSEPATSAARWSDYQTGLFRHDGSAKRAVLQGFKLPFHAEAVEGADGWREVIAFGQVRPGRSSQSVALQSRGPEGDWVTQPSLPTLGPLVGERSGEFATDPHGFYGRRLPFEGPRSYRALWTRRGGRLEASLPVTVGQPRLVAGGPLAALWPDA